MLIKHQFMLKIFKFKHITNVENSPTFPDFHTAPEPQLITARTRSSKVKSGVEHRVSSLDSSRWESLEQGVWGLEVVSGLAGLMGDGTWL